MINSLQNFAYLLLIVLFLQACNNLTEPRKEEVVYDVLSSSIEKFPYKKGGKVVFTDSLNNQCVFEVSSPKNQYLTLYAPVFYRDYKTGEETNFIITTQHYSCYLKCDSLDLELRIVLEAAPHKNSIQNRKVKDQLSILKVSREFGSKRKESQVFYFTLDQRNYPGQMEHNVFDKMSLLETQFFNVIEPESYSPDKMNILYNHEFGILTFIDEQDNYWCFKEYVVENGL